jgi:single-strand DNA-binding protein
MNGFNRVILAGNLTRDPEMRYTPSGTAIAKFGLAINRKWKDQSGELKEEVTFVDVDCFGKTAENCGSYLKKGRPVLVEGRLKLDQWEDAQTQQKRSKLGVVAEGVTFLGSPDGGGERSSYDQERSHPGEYDQTRAPSPRPSPTPRGKPGPAPANDPVEEDDVPF